MKLKLSIEIPKKLEKLEISKLENFLKFLLGYWNISILKIIKETGEKTLCNKIKDEMKWNYEIKKYQFSKELGEELILK